MYKIIAGYLVILLIVGFSTRAVIQGPNITPVDFDSITRGILTAPLGEIPHYYEYDPVYRYQPFSDGRPGIAIPMVPRSVTRAMGEANLDANLKAEMKADLKANLIAVR
jgi:hypothetical protein